MKKILVLCLASVMAFSVAACQPKDSNVSESTSTAATTKETTEETTEEETTAATTEATEAEATEAETTAASSAPVEVTITAEVPDGWEPVDGSVAILQYLKVTSSFIVTEEKYFKSDKLDEIVIEAKDVFSKTFDNVVYEGDPETITVAGQDARQFVLTCDISDMSFKYRIIYVSAGGRIFSFLFADLAETFDGMTGEYDEILAGIQITY